MIIIWNYRGCSIFYNECNMPKKNYITRRERVSSEKASNTCGKICCKKMKAKYNPTLCKMPLLASQIFRGLCVEKLLSLQVLCRKGFTSVEKVNKGEHKSSCRERLCVSPAGAKKLTGFNKRRTNHSSPHARSLSLALLAAAKQPSLIHHHY
jgi:hypothetical protein